MSIIKFLGSTAGRWTRGIFAPLAGKPFNGRKLRASF
jgi:hypothetical protein